ncbi:DUF3021 family protein [Apilactobacillus timberlakei]|uniref:DUF3021 domain-containing protein n=1 Tax=Apilactobacillus timberlakei TaxID=2008380 RepID=A0ABY2YSF5_9LACO|nr:DUF3021 family protein [Apilactobacillus timberlakei]TPR14167.1 DUF3021 domain-containing protein [Apilactobacillus timberlakei]TPR16420.1 DUF3021 domain-containing protein [Apilactobacillus timberlakei]
MELIKRLLREFLAGMLFGSMIYMLTDFYSANLNHRIIYLFICGLIGILTELFNNENIKILYAFILHFFGTLGLVCILNLLLGDYETFEMPYFIQFIIIFLIIYAIIWGISLVFFRNTTKEINDAIKKRNEH